jgi:type IV pilus assembly protein PilB
MVDMGIEPFLIASSVNLIVAQRLVRKLCSDCKAEVKLSQGLATDLGVPEQAGAKVYEAKGCDQCNQTGFKGRQGLYEVMPLSPRLQRLVLDRASAIEIKRQTLREGMTTLRMDGIQKLLKGVTTVDEIMKETAADVAEGEVAE